jgi:predicted small lipoprotein YifL
MAAQAASARQGETQMTRMSAIVIVAVALALGACGVKGPLEPPAGAPPQNDPFVLDPLI